MAMDRPFVPKRRARFHTAGYRLQPGACDGTAKAVRMQEAVAKGFQDVRSSYKTIGLWVILIALFVCFYNIFSRQTEEVQEPTFTALLTKIDEKKVRQVSVKGNTYSGTRTRSFAPPARQPTRRCSSSSATQAST